MTFKEYDDYDGLGLAALVDKGELSPAELVEACLSRIEARNPAINAVVHRMDARAREQAAGPLPEGPFRGVPMLLKDLHAEDAGEPCTGSSRLLAGYVPDRDSELVRRYKASGAVIVGRCNTPEFGIYGVTESALRGPCRNPWDLSRTPGGSSGGSGAAVAARMVPMAHGGDGGGSIRIPASHCGLVGLKPTRGRNPMGPVRGESWGGLVAEHVLTRSVRDCAAMLDATHGPDPGAPYQARDPERPFLDEVGADPGRLRIAYTTSPIFADASSPECVEAVEQAAALASELGHEVEEVRPSFNRELLVKAYLLMVCGGVAAGVRHAAQLAGREPRGEDLEPATWMMKLIGERTTAADYVWHQQAIHRASRDLGAFFGQWDVFLTPTVALPPVEIGAFDLKGSERALIKILRATRSRKLIDIALQEMPRGPMSATPNTMLFNMTGQPALSLPLHWTSEGLPIGTQWVGRFGDEATLLSLAAQLEAARPWKDRTPPNLPG